jgi:hypothetical protein
MMREVLEDDDDEAAAGSPPGVLTEPMTLGSSISTRMVDFWPSSLIASLTNLTHLSGTSTNC